MIELRPGHERGHVNHGWLDSYHTFSFSDYYDPAQMGFSSLRVINEDRVKPSQGFPTHSHRDMEIVTYVLEGALEHKDSMGNGTVIRPGEVQRMSAGTGITHSEYNASTTELVHFLQIWILPDTQGIEPSYEQKPIDRGGSHGRLVLIASPDGRGGSVTVHQDARLYAAFMKSGDDVAHTLAEGRKAYVHVARGAVAMGQHTLRAGDGAKVTDEHDIHLSAKDDAEVLLFDLT
jgi:hypothetical protein